MSDPQRNTLHTEQEHHKQAFEIYLALGAKRSYPKVAAQLGVSPSAVKLWSRSFGWSERLSEREAQESRKIADRVPASGAEVSDRNLKIVRAAILRTAREIAQERVKPIMGDLDRLIRLEEHLLESRPDYSSALAADRAKSMEQLEEELLEMMTETLRRHPEWWERLRASLADRQNGAGTAGQSPPTPQ